MRLNMGIAILLLLSPFASAVYPSPAPVGCGSFSLGLIVAAPGGGGGGFQYAAQWMSEVNGTPGTTRLITNFTNAVGASDGVLMVAIKSNPDSGTSGWIYGVNISWVGPSSNNRAYPLDISWQNQTVSFGTEMNGAGGTPPSVASTVFTGNPAHTFTNEDVGLIIQELSEATEPIEIPLRNSCPTYGGSGVYKTIAVSNLTTRYLGDGGAFLLNMTTPTPPAPSVLTGTNDGQYNQLNWTVGFGATGGYNLTRCDLWNACTTFTFGPASFGYRDGGDTTNRTYYVVGWNSNGTSSQSNNVTLINAPRPLFSDSSALYAGSKSNLAAGLGVTPTALGALWGLLLVLMLAAGGYGLFRGMGAAFGAFAGTVTALAIGMWPVWLVFLLCAVAASVWVLINMRKGGE